MGKKKLEEIMASIKEMQAHVSKGNSGNTAPQVSDDAIRDYVQTELDDGIINKSTITAKYMADLMARNPKNRMPAHDPQYLGLR